MNHKANIAFVDPHAEGHRSHNDLYFLFDERLLIPSSIIIIHAGMIWQSLVSQSIQPDARFFHVLATDAVDDPGFTHVSPQDRVDLTNPITAMLHSIGQIGPVKRSNQNFRNTQLQLFNDVVAHLGRGRCRITVYRCVWKHFPQQLSLRYSGRKSCPHWLIQ